MRTRAMVLGALCAAAGLLAGLLADGRLLPAGAAEGPKLYRVPGDVNGDERLDIGDAIYLLNHLFASGPDPAVCPPPRGAALPATGQRYCYDARGRPIDCDSADYPGQDGYYQAGCPMEGRFIDNGDGTVTDTCTGLMWQRDTADTSRDGSITDADRLTWQQALKYCEDLDFAGHSDWRLPNLRELLSIVDYSRRDPAIAPAFTASTAVSDWYWSSSAIPHFPNLAWVVHFYLGRNDSYGMGLPYYVRAVRGGP